MKDNGTTTGTGSMHRFIVIVTLLAAAFLRLTQLATVPFGWHPDEATKALLARDVLAGKFFPAFFSAFTGREALYVYLEAGLFALIGEEIFVARLLSAFCGIITVALTYKVSERLFGRRVGLLAALFLAMSLWHLIASRNGYRAVIQPLVQVPVVLLLLKGFRDKGRTSLRAFMWGGVWLGLTQYTYTAARFFPVLVVGIVGRLGLESRRRAFGKWRGVALMAVMALVVFVPLGFHFLQNPIDFYGRAAQVSVFSAEWSDGSPVGRLWQSVKETARMFTVWGDINYRFNIAGQPVFGIVDGVLFYGGLLLCVGRAMWLRGAERTGYVITLLWLFIMLLPMTLSAESLPYYQRAIGILPAVFFLPAIAAGYLLQHIEMRLVRSAQAKRFVQPVVMLLLLLWLGSRVHDDYFNRWHQHERNDDDRRVAMVYVSEYLQTQATPGAVYLSTQYVQHPTLALLAPEYYDDVQWFDASQSLPLPAEGEEATYILLRENAPQSLLMDSAPGLESEHTALDRFARPVYDIVTYARPTHPTPHHGSEAYWSWEVTFDEETALNAVALPARFGDVLTFVGHNRRLESVEGGGSRLEIVLFWDLLRRPQRHYTFFAHILDANSQVIAGYDANSFPTPFWSEEGGERLLSYFPLSIPVNLDQGMYQVEIGVYHQPSGERLPIVLDGEIVADRLLLEPLVIGPGS